MSTMDMIKFWAIKELMPVAITIAIILIVIVSLVGWSYADRCITLAIKKLKGKKP
jgi:hypothetical protein